MGEMKLEAEVGEEGIVMREEAGESRATKQAGSAGGLRDGLGSGKEVSSQSDDCFLEDMAEGGTLFAYD